jgi:hypothetical protein
MLLNYVLIHYYCLMNLPKRKKKRDKSLSPSPYKPKPMSLASLRQAQGFRSSRTSRIVSTPRARACGEVPPPITPVGHFSGYSLFFFDPFFLPFFLFYLLGWLPLQRTWAGPHFTSSGLRIVLFRYRDFQKSGCCYGCPGPRGQYLLIMARLTSSLGLPEWDCSLSRAVLTN